MRGRRRRCADETAAQRCGSGAPTLVYLLLRKHMGRQSSRSPATRRLLHQHVSRSPVARRHANALSTKAAQIRMALRHRERNFAPRSAHTTSNHITRYGLSSRSPATRRAHALQAIISHDTANPPAHLGHAAFTPACFALPRGTAPRKRTSHQHLANPHGAATSRT